MSQSHQYIDAMFYLCVVTNLRVASFLVKWIELIYIFHYSSSQDTVVTHGYLCK